MRGVIKGGMRLKVRADKGTLTIPHDTCNERRRRLLCSAHAHDYNRQRRNETPSHVAFVFSCRVKQFF